MQLPVALCKINQEREINMIHILTAHGAKMSRIYANHPFAFSLAIVFVLLGAASCKQPVSTRAAPESPIEVATVLVAERPVVRMRTLVGTLRSGSETKLAAGAMGRLKDVAFKQGTQATKGDTLARVDIRAAKLAASQAVAQRANIAAQKTSADSECERARRLFEANAIPQQALERALSACESAEAAMTAADTQLSLARNSVSDGVIRAPFTGVVTDRLVNPGEYVVPATPIAVFAEIDEMRLEISVPEQELSSVKIGAAVRFTVPSYPDRTFTGIVQRIGASVRPMSRDIVVDATVKNNDHALLPGMFAVVELSLAAEATPVVPDSVVFERDGRSRVFVLANGRIEERVVLPGTTIGNEIAVLRGIEGGDRVVLMPSANLQNGQAAK
jgi:membrane fusion protein, multidrug efflux system